MADFCTPITPSGGRLLHAAPQLSRQILQPANLPAVTTGGLDITYRTSSAPLPEGQNRPETLVALRPKKLEAGSQSPFGIFDHATIDPVCSPAIKTDPRSHEVRKTHALTNSNASRDGTNR